MPRWGWFVLAAVAAVLVVLWGYRLPWTGFGETSFPKSDKVEYRPARTLWDWLGLLIVPVLLAVGGYWFTHRREELAREIEQRRREDESRLAEDRLREEVLQGYLDRMAELMLEGNLGKSAKDDSVRDVARSRTLLTLRRLDGERKGLLLKFLHESGLIINGKTIVRLDGADLSKANLSMAHLHKADLAGTDLGGAILDRAKLSGAFLMQAELREADLSGADLREADLSGATLYRAQLQEACLRRANLSKARLEEADLSRAILSEADLSRAILSEADLSWAILAGADLSGADLHGADLRTARNLIQDQLDSARGDARTQLPAEHGRPSSWGNAAAT